MENENIVSWTGKSKHVKCLVLLAFFSPNSSLIKLGRKSFLPTSRRIQSHPACSSWGAKACLRDQSLVDFSSASETVLWEGSDQADTSVGRLNSCLCPGHEERDLSFLHPYSESSLCGSQNRSTQLDGLKSVLCSYLGSVKPQKQCKEGNNPIK